MEGSLGPGATGGRFCGLSFIFSFLLPLQTIAYNPHMEAEAAEEEEDGEEKKNQGFGASLSVLLKTGLKAVDSGIAWRAGRP